MGSPCSEQSQKFISGGLFTTLCRLLFTRCAEVLALFKVANGARRGMKIQHMLLWDCIFSKEVWSSSSVWDILRNFGRGPFSALCMFLAENG